MNCNIITLDGELSQLQAENAIKISDSCFGGDLLLFGYCYLLLEFIVFLKKRLNR